MLFYYPQYISQPRPTHPLPQTQVQLDPHFDPFDFVTQPEFVPHTPISEFEPEFVQENQPARPLNKIKEKVDAKMWEPQDVLTLTQS